MKKVIAVFVVVQLSTILISAQTQKGKIDLTKLPALRMHSELEYTFDVPADNSHWQKEKPGLHAAFGSTDVTYFRTEVPELNIKSDLQLTGWKGERVNSVLLVWSPDSIDKIRITLNDLKAANGNTIAQKNLKLNLVRYVISNYPYDAKEVTCGEGPADQAYLMPDRFEQFEQFDLPGETVRQVWLSANIPQNTAPGIYTGSIRVQSEKTTQSLQLKIRVQNQTLPLAHDWSFRLDLWQNPSVIYAFHKVKPWNDEFMALLKKHLQLYADIGGKYITTYAVNSPWSDNSYTIEDGMIDWIKRKDGSWKFDYTNFDRYVQLAIELGIDKAITIYTPLPWGERFDYFDETSGKRITEQWLPISEIFRSNWNAFLSDLKAHLIKKGWLNKTYIGVNENAMEQTLAAIKVIRSHSKDWKITYAGDWHPELDSLLDDYSCVFGKEPQLNDVKRRTSKGQTTTYYVCCTPAKPNNFLFSPHIEGRWIGWHSFAYGYEGFLRWAYDAWPGDPNRDSRHVLWPSGDCFLVYPGGNSCIRFEKLREGIIDYEKLRILKAKAAKSSDGSVKKLLQQLEIHLNNFTNEKEFKEEKLKDDLQKGLQLIEELSDKLK